MPYLNIVARMFVGLISWRRWPQVLVLLASLTCAFSVVGCTSDPDPVVAPKIAQGLVRKVCWLPEEKDQNTKYFVFLGDNGEIVSDQDKSAFESAVTRAGLIYEVDEFAPVENLRLIPLTRPDAWCTRVPRPTEEAVLRLLNGCTGEKTQVYGPAAKNLLAQPSEPPIRSRLFCGQDARMAPTTSELTLIRARNAAYQDAYDYAVKTAKALTQAEADMQRVINNDDSWLKRQLTDDPGTLEEIQQRVTDALDSIEAPPEYDDPILESITLAGLNAGFDDGKFEMEAKLFAIDAGITLIEFAIVELATAGVGGVAATAARAGAKAAKFSASAGSKALLSAMKRLENLPIFIPVANGGLGTVVRAGMLLGSPSAKMHRYYLEKALKAAKGPLQRIRQAGQSLHHIVAHSDGRAAKAREILAKFKIDIDEAWNGVFLPATKNSPNPTGAAVHSVVHTTEYYFKVERRLEKAKSRKKVIQELLKIRDELENGTF